MGLYNSFLGSWDWKGHCRFPVEPFFNRMEILNHISTMKFPDSVAAQDNLLQFIAFTFLVTLSTASLSTLQRKRCKL